MYGVQTAVKSTFHTLIYVYALYPSKMSQKIIFASDLSHSMVTYKSTSCLIGQGNFKSEWSKAWKVSHNSQSMTWTGGKLNYCSDWMRISKCHSVWKDHKVFIKVHTYFWKLCRLRISKGNEA